MGKLSWTTKIAFGLGAFGKDLVYAIVATFLMFYLTDVRMVDPVFVGTLFLVARIWDAVNDPVMGMIVDNTRSRFGKFRPWIVIGTILNAIVLFFMYADNSLSENSYKIYIAIFYILWGMTYTIMDIPYWSMVPTLTSDSREREQISAIPRLFASFAWLIIGSFGLTVVKRLGEGDDAKGFGMFALIVSVLFVVTILIMATYTKERVVATQTQEKTTVKRMITVLVKNDQVVVVLAIALFFNLYFQLANAFSLYYFKYVAGDADLYSTYAAVAGIAQIASLAAFPRVSKRFGREKAYACACALPVIGLLVLFGVGFVAPANIALVGLCSAVINVGVGFMLVLTTVMLADVVDYGEYKLKSRNESVIFSIQTFVVKLAGALSGFIAGIGLTCIGYVPNVVQTPNAIWGMRILALLLPATLSILSYVIYRRWYRITGEFHQHVLDSIRIQPAPAADAE